MNRKQVRGTVRGGAGMLEEEVGKLFGNSELQRRGNAKRVSARIERIAGDATETIKALLRRY